MTNYPTILGHEPEATGIVPGGYPRIPRRVLDDAYTQQIAISLARERILRFPLVARIEGFGHGKRKLGGSWYRWMLYALPHDADLNQVEAELKNLNERYRFPLLVADISTGSFHYPHLAGKNVTRAPVFVPALRPFVA